MSWRKALTLTERIQLLGNAAPSFSLDDVAALTPLMRRVVRFHPQPDRLFTPEHAQIYGVTAETLTAAAVAFPEQIARRPHWAARIEESYHNPRRKVANTSRSPGLLSFWAPMLQEYEERFASRAESILTHTTDPPFEMATALHCARENVGRLLLPLVAKTLALEVNVAREQGILQGETPERQSSHARSA